MSHKPVFTADKPDLRSRKSMVDYLSGHFRYDTMSSWNRSTSYAHCVKLHKLGLDSKQYDEASALVFAEDDDDMWGYEVRAIINAFTEKMGGAWTIGQNGRSGGYMVLYRSEYRMSDYKSVCMSCGQRDFASVVDIPSLKPAEVRFVEWVFSKGHMWTLEACKKEPQWVESSLSEDRKIQLLSEWRNKVKSATLHNKCGGCHASGERGRVNASFRELRVFSGKEIDMGFDPEDMSMDDLRNRCRLVMSFDEAVEAMRLKLLELIGTFEVVRRPVKVTKVVTKSFVQLKERAK